MSRQGRFPLIIATLLFLLAACQQATVEEVIPPLVLEPAPTHAEETLAKLLAAEPPERDLADLAQRLGGIDVQAPPATIPQVGATETFWYRRGGVNNTQVEATLVYQNEHVNFWVEADVDVDEGDVEEAAVVLSEQLFPRTREFFGTEAQPGIDGDPRINILHLREIGGSGAGTTAVGYFYAADQYPATANEFSNQREMFYISLEQAPIASDAYYKVIAHEMQHMIHANGDRNEPAWADEGLAELSNYVNGYPDVESVQSYVELTDVQLNDWKQGTAEDLAHYGASFLFSSYFLDRFGEEATKQVVSNQANGFGGFGQVLAPMTVEQFFADWTVANYLTSIGRSQAPYTYASVEIPAIQLAAEHDSFPVSAESGVYQYGTDYIRIESDTPVQFSFTGSQQTTLMPTEPHSGNHFFTTYPADRSDMTLTRAFDLSSAEGMTTTLNFWTWYEIEAGWDYAYILVSADNGNTWEMQRTIYSTNANPQGNNYGTALTGLSKGGINEQAEHGRWTEMNVDLSPYAGQQILLRFEYVTDDAVYEAGWALDNITISAIGYSEDFENGTGGWEGNGFVHHTNVLPQHYILQAIYLSDSDIRVEQLPLTAQQTGNFQLDFDEQFNEAILIISGSTPITSQRTAYQYELTTE